MPKLIFMFEVTTEVSEGQGVGGTDAFRYESVIVSKLEGIDGVTNVRLDDVLVETQEEEE